MAELYGRWPTQGEFIARLVSEYNVTVEAVVLDYFAAARPRILRRFHEDGKEIGFAAAPQADDAKLITPDSIEYICRRLAIDPKDFNVVSDD